MNIGKATDVGRIRKQNEDSMLSLTDASGHFGLFVVADGLGGHNKGEVASSMVVHHLEKGLALMRNGEGDKGALLERLIHDANKVIFDYARENPDCYGMGSTTTATLINETKMWIAHVGDSRAYIVNDDGITQITKDHSLVQELIDSGKLTEDEAKFHNRNVITRAVGISSDVEVDLYERVLYNDDRLVVCSDGLTTMVSDDEIREIAQKYAPQEACDALVALANERGGYDNITVIIAHVDALQKREEVLSDKTVTQLQRVSEAKERR